MIKSMMTKVYKPIQTIFLARKKKKDMQKMMAVYLKIKATKFCAIYNNKRIAL